MFTMGRGERMDVRPLCVRRDLGDMGVFWRYIRITVCFQDNLLEICIEEMIASGMNTKCIQLSKKCIRFRGVREHVLL